MNEVTKMKRYIVGILFILIFVIAGCSDEVSISEYKPSEDFMSEENNQSEIFSEEEIVIKDTCTMFAEFLFGEIEASIHEDMDASDVSYHLSGPLEGTFEDMKSKYISDCGNENLKTKYAYLNGTEEDSVLGISFYNEGSDNEWDVTVYVLLANIDNKLQVIYEGTSYSRGSLNFYENGLIVSAGSSGATVHVTNKYLVTPYDIVDCISEYVSVGLENYHYLFSDYSDYYDTTFVNYNTVNGQVYVYVYMGENENEILRDAIEQSEICTSCIICETEEEFNNLSMEYVWNTYEIDIAVEAEKIQWTEF